MAMPGAVVAGRSGFWRGAVAGLLLAAPPLAGTWAQSAPLAGPAPSALPSMESLLPAEGFRLAPLGEASGSPPDGDNQVPRFEGLQLQIYRQPPASEADPAPPPLPSGALPEPPASP